VHDPQLIREVQAASKLQQQEAAQSAARRQAKQQQQQQQQRMLGQPPAPLDALPFFAAAGGVDGPPRSPAAAADGMGAVAAAAAADDIISDGDDSPMVTPRSRSCSMQPAAAEQQQQQQRSTAATISHGSELGAAHILDCYLGPATYSCAAAAAGAAVDVSVAVVRGLAPAGAGIIRPPGHHAEGGLAMGFCYFNNAAVAARAAQRVGGAETVLILDWDVHHGNGTAAIFEDDPTVMYMSLHRWVGLNLLVVFHSFVLLQQSAAG
jgi:hypothetical protein